MANLGIDLGESIAGAYDAVPPPGVGDLVVSSYDHPMAGLSLRRGLRGIKRGISKGARGAGRGLKKAGKLAVKVHTAPIKWAAKQGAKALKAIAMTAAKPIRNAFRKLGMRRARYLSWQARRSTTPNASEKAQASAWTVAKLKRNPAGWLGVKILKATHGHSVSGASIQGALDEAAAVGFTGVEIAAAAAAVLGAIAGLIQSLNKPGEAPADPKAAEQQTDAPAADPADAPAEAPAEEPTTDPDSAGSIPLGWNMKRAGWTMPTRYITLAEAEAAVRKLMTVTRFGMKLYPTQPEAEKELIARLYQRKVGLVADVNGLPNAEKSMRKQAGEAALVGAVMGKKAYRNRVAAPPAAPPARDPAGSKSADDMLRDAERYGGYRSRKEQIKAAKRDGSFAMGDVAVMGPCAGDCDVAGCCNHAAGSDDLLGESVEGESIAGYHSGLGFNVIAFRNAMAAKKAGNPTALATFFARHPGFAAKWRARQSTRRGAAHFGANPRRRAHRF